MAQTIAAAFSDFLTALTGVFFSLANSVLAVFQAIAVLGKEIFVGAVQLGESVVSLLLGLLQGVYGFVAGMFSRCVPLANLSVRCSSQRPGNRGCRGRVLYLHDKEYDERREACQVNTVCSFNERARIRDHNKQGWF